MSGQDNISGNFSVYNPDPPSFPAFNVSTQFGRSGDVSSNLTLSITPFIEFETPERAASLMVDVSIVGTEQPTIRGFGLTVIAQSGSGPSQEYSQFSGWGYGLAPWQVNVSNLSASNHILVNGDRQTLALENQTRASGQSLYRFSLNEDFVFWVLESWPGEPSALMFDFQAVLIGLGTPVPVEATLSTINEG